jgi:hypothetical protein
MCGVAKPSLLFIWPSSSEWAREEVRKQCSVAGGVRKEELCSRCACLKEAGEKEAVRHPI